MTSSSLTSRDTGLLPATSRILPKDSPSWWTSCSSPLQQTLAAAPTPQELACLLETPHGLLMTALVEAGLAVYPVNPKTVERRRKPSGAKTDAIDAYLLAKTGRRDLPELRRLLPDSPVLHELKALCRDQEALVANQTRLVKQLTACLKAYYPLALELFSKLHQPLTIAFLQTYPTLEAVRGASQDELAALLRRSCGASVIRLQAPPPRPSGARSTHHNCKLMW